MAKKAAARRRGRPKAENPKSIQLNVRIDETLRDALDSYRAKSELEDLSDATRHLLRRTLKSQGFLK
ncbi:MAG TPA: hypothetical protein VGR35_00210 [Tepidisphaeraceae bacterium]|nr:hypothetical protein [Tepidisphaeraceae bacterium]